MLRANIIVQNNKGQQKAINQKLGDMNNELVKEKQAYNQKLFNKFSIEILPLIKGLFPTYGALKSIRWSQSRNTNVEFGNVTTESICLQEIGVWLNEYLNSDIDSHLLNRKIYTISELKYQHESLHQTLWNLSGILMQYKEILFAFGTNIMIEFFADKIQITNYDNQKTQNFSY